MKTERLHTIMVYLLNHGRTPARKLAKYCEVSLRTIQRDIDSLCMAGIPIISVAGSEGGYEISDGFKLDKQFATSNDYSYILTALQGLVSATQDSKAKNTLEKIRSVSDTNNNGIILDFSVLRECDRDALQMLQTAAAGHRAVEFTYTNNNNETRLHNVEPIAVIYRWYAWYLLAYSKVKDDYRTYKIVRMSNLKITDQPFIKEHEAADVILEKTDRIDTRQYTDVLIKCKPRAKSRAVEYLRGTVLQELPNGDTLLKITVVENEHLWLATLLSLGDNVEVIEPQTVRNKIIKAAEKILLLYDQL